MDMPGMNNQTEISEELAGKGTYPVESSPAADPTQHGGLSAMQPPTHQRAEVLTMPPKEETLKTVGDISTGDRVPAGTRPTPEVSTFTAPLPKSTRPGQPSSLSYTPPNWGAVEAPGVEMSLMILRGGVEIGKIDIGDRGHYLLGRQQGVVDILLEHPSISRQHAVLQFDRKGSLFLLDNGSTHGCVVNKKKIPVKEYHRLSVGDVLRFGESTRLYALEGPEGLKPPEYESENLRLKRLEAGRKQIEAKMKLIAAQGRGQGEDGGEFGISWGFDEDAVEEDEEDEPEGEEGGAGEKVELPEYLQTEAHRRWRRETRSGIAESSVHSRDTKVFEKLQQKLKKVEHLLTENERIAAKEGVQGGLSDGQTGQMARNDQAVLSLRSQIEELEDTIRQKNKQREGAKAKAEAGTAAGGARGESGAEDSDEDDDFYDRTSSRRSALGNTTRHGEQPISREEKKAEVKSRRFGHQKGVKGGARAYVGGVGGAPESYEALERRREVAEEDLKRVKQGLLELEAEAGHEEEGSASADPLDSFMSSNRENARQQALQLLSNKHDSLKQELIRLRGLLDLTRPSLPELKVNPLPLPAVPPVPAPAPVPAPGPALPPAEAGGGKGSISSGAATEEEKTVASDDVAARGTPATNDVSLQPAAGGRHLDARETGAPASMWEEKAGGMEGLSEDKSAGLGREVGVGRGDSCMSSPPPREVITVAGDAKASRKRSKPLGPLMQSPAMVPPAKRQAAQSQGGEQEVGVGDRGSTPGGRGESRQNGAAVLPARNPPPQLEGREMDWVPPRSQAGDGRTALNEKYGY